jgi:glycerophosphoryl diester phosphodiesterase
MAEIINALLIRLGRSWRQILIIHLVYTGLGVVLFAPLLGITGQALLSLSGEPALADMDLLYFALSPAGLLAIILFTSMLIVVFAFELTSLMAIGIVDESSTRMKVLAAVAFSLVRMRRIFSFSVRLVVRVLLLTLPFLAAAGAVALVLLTDYDINYYLTTRPPEFWIAVIIIALLVIAMIGLLAWQLAKWSLALPLLLFGGSSPAASFADSARLTRAQRPLILKLLVLVTVTALILGSIVAFCISWLASLLVPYFVGSLPVLVIILGIVAGIWLLLNVLLTALTSGSLAFLLTALAERYEPLMQSTTSGTDKAIDALVHRSTPARFALSLIVAVGIAAFISFELLDDIQVGDDVSIIAHRGASGAAPENTLASIQRAIEDGADWIEIDVQESADGQVIVVHDSDFMKLAGVNLKVWDGTLAEIRELDVGSSFAAEFVGEQVPTLAQVLEVVKGKSGLIVELKYYGHDQALEQRVVDLIEAANMRDQTMIMSLEYAGIKKIRELRPDWIIGLLSAQAIGDLTRVDADFLAVSTRLANSSFIRSAQAAGKQVYVWTVNDALAMSHMMSLGIDGVITDEPRLGRQVLATRTGLSSVERLLLQMAFLFGQEILFIPEQDSG